MDGQTDGQGDSYIPPQTLFAGGIIRYDLVVTDGRVEIPNSIKYKIRYDLVVTDGRVDIPNSMKYKGNAKRGVSPHLKIRSCDLDL